MKCRCQIALNGHFRLLPGERIENAPVGAWIIYPDESECPECGEKVERLEEDGLSRMLHPGHGFTLSTFGKMTKAERYARHCWRLADLPSDDFVVWYGKHAQEFENMASVLITRGLVKRMQEWQEKEEGEGEAVGKEV